jgi:hypothetical protein
MFLKVADLAALERRLLRINRELRESGKIDDQQQFNEIVFQGVFPQSWHMPFSDNRYGSDVTGTRVISGLDPIFPSTREHRLLVD